MWELWMRLWNEKAAYKNNSFQTESLKKDLATVTLNKEWFNLIKIGYKIAESLGLIFTYTF